ncbi:uncharacterized protein [Dendrobates tinctorius]|uniref:uncharacterized protein n=1 Tax=Dendrobates tinctorius TaxID=92724 RepID=UPI003CCA3CE4
MQRTSPKGKSMFLLRFLGVIHNQDLLKDIEEAYHSDSLLAQPPRDTNGQTERTNQTLEQYLRCFICHLHDDWVVLLLLAEFSYNNSQSASTKQSPFYANLGYHPNILPRFPIDTPLLAVAERITSLQKNTDLLKENLELAQERYKKAADKFCKPAPAFKAATPNTLPGCSSPRPDPVLVDGQEEFVVERILDSRLYRNQFQYLIKWQGYTVEDNSWEPVNKINAPRLLRQFHQRYPHKLGLRSSGGCP